MDTKALRNVLGCYATGVTVITARLSDGSRIGVTVNSFASLSLDPPLIQFALARTANVLAGFHKADHFAVNILGRGQEVLSNMFARPSTASWADVLYVDNAHGCALLANSIAQLECTKSAELEGGDHVILLGKVTAFHLREEAEPLLFYRGRYGTYASNRWNSLAPVSGTLSDFSVAGWG
jgi:flavin reductase (DIM6/NTAB) family NADH-FMN oxidoreductase RutF